MAAAVKEALNARGEKPLFIGSSAGQDRQWFEGDGGFAQTIFLPSRGVMNRRGLGRVFALLNTLQLAWRCRKILKENRVRAVLSVGGYSAAPAALATLTLKKTALFIHEQNAVGGTLNRLLRPFAKAFFSSFEAGGDCPDYPVKTQFFSRARVRSGVKTVLFLGGSQGAAAINAFARQCAPMLSSRGIQIIHQTGKTELETMRSFYQEAGINARCFDFDANVIDAIVQADLAIARAGAGTLFELTANALPALYVPYPHAAGDHQRANARFLSDRGLSWQCDQQTLTPSVLEDLLDRDLSAVSSALGQQMRPGGADCLADRLMKEEAQQH